MTRLERYVDNRETVLEDFEYYFICPCQYLVEPDDQMYCNGYSLILKSDGNVQSRMPSMAALISVVYQYEQVLSQHYQVAEQRNEAKHTEQLLGETDILPEAS